MADGTMGTTHAGQVLGSAVHGGGPFWNQLKCDVGTCAFTLTNDTQVEVVTTLTTCIAALLTPKTIAGAAGDDALYCDRAITSAKITVGRDQEVADNLEFSFAFFGY